MLTTVILSPVHVPVDRELPVGLSREINVVDRCVAVDIVDSSVGNLTTDYVGLGLDMAENSRYNKTIKFLFLFSFIKH